MSSYNIVLSTNESTVVTEYEPQKKHSEAYQSEASLEKAFIRLLQDQGYEYIQIHDSLSLEVNLRKQLELLNNYQFSEKEWQTFFKNCISNPNESIVEKTRKIQEDYIQVLTRDDGMTQNIKLIDKTNIHNNRLQVINQYEVNSGTSANRYDVTILVNGLPLVHVELKRRGIPIKEAFNQINRYQRESFWADSGLYEYVQIFVISNGTNTKYYSNTTRNAHIKENEKASKKSAKRTSNSFEFTSFWADANNKIIPDLVDFTKTFFSKHTILNILTRYCVFTSEELLLVMRPYQIVATEKILNRIEISTNYKKVGSIEAGGYIWHTTGSGKTLTSFKTAQLATALPYIDKVLFVVDRKDLDYQTMKEYDRFEKGAANGNKNTAKLKKQLEDDTSKIIVTTIQKLEVFVKKNKDTPVYTKHLVIIFDECHRSQFGDMHKDITKHFKNYHIFGFTGTPIFSVNASSSSKYVNLRTTEQAFGDKLHTYTIVDAINDGNVLPFRIDYVNTIKQKKDAKDKDVNAINTEEALEDDERVEQVSKYILEHFDQKTVRNKNYDLKGQRVFGFNAMFAVSSIKLCKKYYLELKRQNEALHKNLNIATIFSYAPNEEDPSNGILTDESGDTEGLDVTAKEFLSNAIKDYNETFKTNFSVDGDHFQDYYKDLSDRIKKREVDLVIVVNMFLTGFDATTLNTLWVDKNLKMHGLIQAFSRTNRILNSVKTFGNIVCFRSLEQNTNEAIALFGDKDASGVILLKSFKDYYEGYKDDKGIKHIGYVEALNQLQTNYPLGEQIVGEENEKEFIKLFGTILRLRNILSAFDDFADKEILTPRDLQDYTGIYQDLHEKYARPNVEPDSIIDDVIFEMELVKQVEVNIDYILELVEQYHKSNCVDKTILGAIQSAISSSISLRSKKDLIEKFIATINTDSQVTKDWQGFVKDQCEEDLAELIANEKLKEKETRKFISNSFRDGVLKTTGTDIDSIMPAVSRFGGGGSASRDVRKKNIIDKLKEFFEKYFGLISTSDDDVNNMIA